mgnify:FL=1
MTPVALLLLLLPLVSLTSLTLEGAGPSSEPDGAIVSHPAVSPELEKSCGIETMELSLGPSEAETHSLFCRST